MQNYSTPKWQNLLLFFGSYIFYRDLSPAVLQASFVAEGSSDINIDDPDFWQKWAEKAKLALDELANKDSLVLDTPRLRRKVTRYGNDNVEEIVDMSDAIDEVHYMK